MLGWRDVPVEPDVPRRHRPRGDAGVPAAVRHRRRAAPPASTSTARCSSPASGSSTSCRRSSDLLPVAVGAHARLQGDAHHAAAGRVLPRPRATSGSRARSLLVHSRFSTNTFPSWPLAHPYRYIAHNGEINTVQGNQNWMRAREAMLASPQLPGLERAFPICTPGALRHGPLRRGARAAAPRRPPAAPRRADDDPRGVGEPRRRWTPTKRAFYRFHAALMEPWDGPASVAFTDGTVIGAVLDRNGLRPSRYWVTDDDLVVMAARSACSTSTRPRSSARAACSRAGCS